MNHKSSDHLRARNSKPKRIIADTGISLKPMSLAVRQIQGDSGRQRNHVAANDSTATG